MKDNEQIVMFDTESKSVNVSESKSASSSKIKLLEKDIEELKHKVDVLYKSLRR